jgi:hypothetical protein
MKASLAVGAFAFALALSVASAHSADVQSGDLPLDRSAGAVRAITTPPGGAGNCGPIFDTGLFVPMERDPFIRGPLSRNPDCAQ